MSRVFRLTTMKTGPIALSTEKGFVHFGLYGMTVICTELANDASVKVEVKRYNFCKDAGLMNDPLLPEIAKAFGLRLEDIAILNKNGSEKLSAEQMCESMKASCRLLSCLGNMLQFANYSVVLQVNFATLYTKPVANMSELTAIDMNFRERIPLAKPDESILREANFDGRRKYYRPPYKNATDLSLFPVGRGNGAYTWETKDVTVENLYTLVKDFNGDRNWNKVKPANYGDDEHCFMIREPRKGYDGKYYEPLFSGEKLAVAYTHCSPWCKANGNHGAKPGLGIGMKLSNGVGKVLYLTSKKVGDKQESVLEWQSYYARGDEKVPSLILGNAWAIPRSGSDLSNIAKAFKSIPAVTKLSKMLDVLHYSRYGKEEVDATATLSQGELATVMYGILVSQFPNDAYLKGILDRGFMTDADVDKLLGNYVLDAIQETRKTNPNIQKAAELCKNSATLSDKGVAFSPSGEPIDVEGVKFVFYPVTFKGKSGCYPKLVSISEEVLRDGAIISIPAVGEVVGKNGKTTQLPVVAITPEFCSDKAWRTAIRGIVLPSSVVQLVGKEKVTDDGVFSGFTNLELLDMSACTDLKLIGEGAICNCPHLHEINMPDVKASEGYTIHKKAFCDLPSVSKLKIRAKEILNNAFSTVSIYSLDLDAEQVKSRAFFLNVVVEGDLTIGESFKEIGTNGLSNLCNGKDITIKLPNILTLGNSALSKDTTETEKSGTVEIGETLTGLGSGAVSGWANVILNPREGGVLNGALRGVGAVKVHANSPYDNEATKSIPQDNISYFEGEEISDYRKEADAYLQLYSAFIAENGGTVQQFLDNSTPEDAICMETDLPSLLSIIGNQNAITGNPKNFFAQHIVDGSLTFTEVNKERPFIEDTVMWVDIAVLRTLMAIAVPVPIQLINIYSNADLYARCERHKTVHRSDNLIIERFLYETADFRTELTMYSVTLKENGNTYLFMSNGCDRDLSASSEVCEFVGMSGTELEGISDVAYKSVPGFEMKVASEGGDDISALLADTCNAPFLTPGDYVKVTSPTLCFEAMGGKKNTFIKYLKTIVASAVILTVPSGFVIYQPLEKWKITITKGMKMEDGIRVDERQTTVSLPTFCKELVALKCSAVKAITDPQIFAKFAELAIHPKKSVNTNFEKVLDKFHEVKSNTTGKALPLSKDLFDVITQYGSYIMSSHAGTGALANENNLTLSKETEQRKLMADGNYLQCFVAARITKGKQMAKDDLTVGERAAYRGGAGQLWYRIYEADKGGTPIATYVSSYGIEELLLHLKSFDFSKGMDAFDIPYGKLIDKDRFIFDSDTMPRFFDKLIYRGGAGIETCKAKVGCALDRYTGRWYMVSSDIVPKEDDDKKTDEEKKKERAEARNKLYVLFPISNIAFASAVMLGLSGTKSTSTRDYLVELLNALKDGNPNSAVLCRYREACAELAKDASEFSTDKPDRKRIMELTDFFLAPCLG